MLIKNFRISLFLVSMAMGLCAMSLALVQTSPAVADDDDGGGDDGGGGGGTQSANDRSGSSVTGAIGRKIKRAARKRQVVRKARRAAVQRPLLVAMDLDRADLVELRRLGFQILRSDKLRSIGVRVELLRLPRNVSLPSARQILERLGAAAADQNARYRPQVIESCAGKACSPFTLVGLAPGDTRICAARPTLGLIETRVDTRHPALLGQPISVLEFRADGTRPPSSAHGTAITLIMSGTRSSSIPGLLPDATVIVAVPYHRSKNGEDIALAYDVVRSIDALVANNATVINMSLAGPANQVVERAVKQARNKGIPVVAAVGNAGARAKPMYPAAYDATVAVTAVSGSFRVYRRACQGEHVDFAAPGVEIEVEGETGKRQLKTGTSFAVPYVTAALAARRASNPTADVATLVEDMAKTARDLGAPGKDRVFGWGLVQLSGYCTTAVRE